MKRLNLRIIGIEGEDSQLKGPEKIFNKIQDPFMMLKNVLKSLGIWSWGHGGGLSKLNKGNFQKKKKRKVVGWTHKSHDNIVPCR